MNVVRYSFLKPLGGRLTIEAIATTSIDMLTKSENGTHRPGSIVPLTART